MGTEPTTRGEPTHQWLSQVDCRTAAELLKAGRYRRVAKLLHEAQAAIEGAGDAILADILAAARKICLALAACQAEVEWHQRAYEEADQREHELKQQLHAILDLVSGRKAPETPEMWSAVPTMDPSQPERDTPESEERPGFRQRLQNLLGRGLGPLSSQRGSLVVSVEKPARPSGEKAETPAVPVPVPEREAATVSPVEKEKPKERAAPSLVVYCLGPFRVYQDEQPVEDWPSSKGKCIFKYLITHRQRPVAKEVLMDLFWRNAHPEAARNNLNVAIYGLRQAFRAVRPDFPHILFQDDCYLLNPALAVWVDFEEFVQRYEAGQSFERRGTLAEAIREYEAAEALYQGDFLEEDLYQDWPIPRREGLKDSYLVILDRLSRYYLKEKRYATCMHLCREILAKDDCREDAHRRLMRCYSRQGQRNLALRQYHLFVRILARVLEVPPMPETVALYHQIHNGETV